VVLSSLMTGMRDQEVMHTFWSDLNFKANTVRVTRKPEYNWTPKHTSSARRRHHHRSQFGRTMSTTPMSDEHEQFVKDANALIFARHRTT